MLQQQSIFDLVAVSKFDLSSFDSIFNCIITETEWPEDRILMTEIKITRAFSKPITVGNIDGDAKSDPPAVDGEAEESDSEAEADFKEACSMRIINNGRSMSVYFFGKKGFVVNQRQNGKMTIDVLKALLPACPAWVSSIHETKGGNRFALNDIIDTPGFFAYLRLLKEHFFRKVSAEPAACCNSYLHCSDQLACIKQHSLVAVSCYYRRNLEKGKVFYGKNRTVDMER